MRYYFRLWPILNKVDYLGMGFTAMNVREYLKLKNVTIYSRSENEYFVLLQNTHQRVITGEVLDVGIFNGRFSTE